MAISFSKRFFYNSVTIPLQFITYLFRNTCAYLHLSFISSMNTMLEGFVKKKIKSFHYVIMNCVKNDYREEVPQRNTKFKVFFVLDLTCSVTCCVTDMTSDLKKQQKFRH